MSIREELKSQLYRLAVALSGVDDAGSEVVMRAVTELENLERFAYPEETYLPKRGEKR